MFIRNVLVEEEVLHDALWPSRKTSTIKEPPHKLCRLKYQFLMGHNMSHHWVMDALHAHVGGNFLRDPMSSPTVQTQDFTRY